MEISAPSYASDQKFFPQQMLPAVMRNEPALQMNPTVNYTQMGDGRQHHVAPQPMQQRSLTKILGGNSSSTRSGDNVPLASVPESEVMKAIGSVYDQIMQDPLQQYKTLIDMIEKQSHDRVAWAYGTDTATKVREALKALIEIVRQIPPDERRAFIIVNRLKTVHEHIAANVQPMQITYQLGVLQGRCDEWQFQDREAMARQALQR